MKNKEVGNVMEMSCYGIEAIDLFSRVQLNDFFFTFFWYGFQMI